MLSKMGELGAVTFIKERNKLPPRYEPSPRDKERGILLCLVEEVIKNEYFANLLCGESFVKWQSKWEPTMENVELLPLVKIAKEKSDHSFHVEMGKRRGILEHWLCSRVSELFTDTS